MWNNGDGRVKLDWNNFDIEGCDGKEESLTDGGTLMICGNGVGRVDGTTIGATLVGEVRFAMPGRAQVSCHHGLPFTFQRAAAGARSR